MATLTLDEFSGAVGKDYAVEGEGQSVSLTLVEATALANSGREGGAFRLEYRGPADPLLPQAIYSFRRGGEAHDIFIVPIARDGEGTRYEAVFF